MHRNIVEKFQHRLKAWVLLCLSSGIAMALFLPAISDSTSPFFSTQRSTFIVSYSNQVPGIAIGFQILPFKGAFVLIVFLLWFRNSTGRDNFNKGKDHDHRSIASGCHPKSTMHTPLCFFFSNKDETYLLSAKSAFFFHKLWDSMWNDCSFLHKVMIV